MPIQSFCIKLYKSKNKDWQQGIFQNIESEVWLFCIKYGNSLLDILLLRTNMSEWKVWVTMPQVPNTALQQSSEQTALSLGQRRVCICPGPTSQLLHCASLFPPPQAPSFHSVYSGVADLHLVDCRRPYVLSGMWFASIGKPFPSSYDDAYSHLLHIVCEMRDQGPGPSSTG